MHHSIIEHLCDAGRKSIGRPGRGGVTALGDPEEATWRGIWVPGVAAEHDLVDWDQWSGQVDDNLVELMREGERLTGVDVGRADLFRGPGRGDEMTLEAIALSIKPGGSLNQLHVGGAITTVGDSAHSTRGRRRK